jgi:hypothetical protein
LRNLLVSEAALFRTVTCIKRKKARHIMQQNIPIDTIATNAKNVMSDLHSSKSPKHLVKSGEIIIKLSTI